MPAVGCIGRVLGPGVELAGFASLAVLWASSAAAQSNWDEVVAAATKEGKVVFYNGQTGWPEPIAAAKSFEAKYRIKVEMLEIRSVELMEHTRTEVTNDKAGGDATLMGSTGTAPLVFSGLLQWHGGFPNLANVAPEPLGA